MAVSKKCLTSGCHKRVKLTEKGQEMLRESSEQAGRPAAVLCPDCVKRAFNDPEHYAVDVPLGDVILESMRDDPRWYICFPPVSS